MDAFMDDTNGLSLSGRINYIEKEKWLTETFDDQIGLLNPLVA